MFINEGYIWKDQEDGIQALLRDDDLPLDKLLIETDAPFMFPFVDKVCTGTSNSVVTVYWSVSCCEMKIISHLVYLTFVCRQILTMTSVRRFQRMPKNLPGVVLEAEMNQQLCH